MLKKADTGPTNAEVDGPTLSCIYPPHSIDRFNRILSNVPRGRPVGLVTRPRAGQPRNRSSTSGGGRIFSTSLSPDGR